jgi:hypothetical protein
MKISTLIIFILLCSCGQSLTVEEYARYMHNPKNGLSSKIKNQHNEYTLKYIPKDMLCYNEAKGDARRFDEIRSDYEGLEYFQLSILNNKDFNSKEERSFYYAYLLENDIYQIIREDTIRPSLYLLEQGIGGGKSLNINIAFVENQNENRTVYINDKYGDASKHTIQRESISKIPNLNL